MSLVHAKKCGEALEALAGEEIGRACRRHRRAPFSGQAVAAAGALAQLIGQETPVPCSPQ